MIQDEKMTTQLDKIKVMPAFQRLSLVTGLDALETLSKTRVIVFGLGGVGSWCAEALVRSAIGNITLVDSDTVCVTNINRQIQATTETVGQFKADALKNRLLQINNKCNITVHNKVFSLDSANDFNIEGADYIIDAIDSLSCKLDLIEMCASLNKTIFSSMGMAQKLDPSQIKTTDIWKSSGCPLARHVRSGLRKRGFNGHFTVVYSKERLPLQNGANISCASAQCLCSSKNKDAKEWCSSKKIINGSAVTVTASAGFILASLVVNDVVKL